MKLLKKVVIIMSLSCLILPLAVQGTAAAPATFKQGLWKGEDPKCTFDPVTKYYYYMQNDVDGTFMYRSKSLVDRTEKRIMPNGFPLHAPAYVEKMNGVTYNKWYSFGDGGWVCDGDPFTGKWTRMRSYGFDCWTLDYRAFKVESGEHAGEWYLLWAGNGQPGNMGWGEEKIFISKLLEPDRLENNKSNASNMVVDRGSWRFSVAEAPDVIQKNGTVTIIYSGDGAQSANYSLGLTFYKGSGELTNPANWVSYNEQQPEFRSNQKSNNPNVTYSVGVAATVPSPDGTEMWMYYQSKVYFSLWKPAEQKEEWTRVIDPYSGE